jgi:hypothetical protein
MQDPPIRSRALSDDQTPRQDVDEQMDDPIDDLEPDEDVSEEEGWEQADQAGGEAPSG